MSVLTVFFVYYVNLLCLTKNKNYFSRDVKYTLTHEPFATSCFLINKNIALTA
jgi:hypothetical protein